MYLCFAADGAADGSKPSDKVHLFDFLGEKFPDAEEPTKESIASAAANSSSLQNNGRKFGDNSNTSSRNRGNSTNEGTRWQKDENGLKNTMIYHHDGSRW